MRMENVCGIDIHIVNLLHIDMANAIDIGIAMRMENVGGIDIDIVNVIDIDIANAIDIGTAMYMENVSGIDIDIVNIIDIDIANVLTSPLPCAWRTSVALTLALSILVDIASDIDIMHCIDIDITNAIHILHEHANPAINGTSNVNVN